GIDDNSIDAIHAEDPQFTNSFYQLYDGTIGIVGSETLIWRQEPIKRERLQIVPWSVRSQYRRIEPLSHLEFWRHARRARIFLTPTGGLTNRLMALVSCMRLAELFDRDLYVEWQRTVALNCSWKDLFSTPIREFAESDLEQIPSNRRFNR